jgi:hypothetical protein
MGNRADFSLKEYDSAALVQHACRSSIGSIFESMSVDSGTAADGDNAPVLTIQVRLIGPR